MCTYFYPRSPCGERLLTQWCIERHMYISIHALLAESDASILTGSSTICYFYPRSPCGERLKAVAVCGMLSNFYPRSPCGERPKLDDAREAIGEISIHALLAESDLHDFTAVKAAAAISIHALLAESDRKYPRGRYGPGRISIHALLAESDR